MAKKTVANISKTKSDSSVSDKQLITAYKQMFEARKIDDKAIILYKQNKAHFQIGCAGHEAVQIAAAHVLKPGHDWAYPYYRDMAFCTAWGVTAKEHFLSILNKADDPASGGRQMPMHYGHKKLNIVSQSSPTGTQFLQAVGAAKAIVYNDENKVVYVSSGEGTTAQGTYYEALNWAAREKLPVIFLIQDNDFAISVHISEQIAGSDVAKVAEGFEGLVVKKVNGLDYQESLEVLSAASTRARDGQGPTLVVADVVRLQSHSISDNQAKYRSKEDIEHDRANDPLLLLRKKLEKQKRISSEQLRSLEQEIIKSVDEAAAWAEKQPDPDPASVLDHVLISSGFNQTESEVIPQGEPIYMVDALNHALDEEMKINPKMVIYGQDVAYGKGGVFSVTAGLTAKHGSNRVFNSPLAEESIVGTSVGMATLGIKPVVEIQFGDYVWPGMMQLRNELALLHYRSNGAFSCPAVIRIAVGGYIHGGVYHSQNIEACFAHVPGLIVAYPSNATDAKGLLKSAIRAKDPVLFLEHKGLYRQVYAKGPEGGVEDLIPLGRAKVIRAGDAATIITWGALVQKCILARDSIEKKSGVKVEVIDIRTVSPLDISTIIKSVKKTHRALVVHEDYLFTGFGAEIAAEIAELAFEYLDAPIRRVGGLFCPTPHAPILEEQALPQTKDVTAAIEELLSI
jgi:2-oxoisovalerate dehydrogenase E1 component